MKKLSILFTAMCGVFQIANAQYCAPKAICDSVGYIDNFSITTDPITTIFSNISGCKGYTDYTYLGVTDLVTETGYIVNINVAPSGVAIAIDVGNSTEYSSGVAWIDYDQSGTFEDSEAMSTPTSASGEIKIPITIPSDALPGLTRMRVRADRVMSATQIFDNAFACKDSSNETEDYLVNIIYSNATGFTPACATNPTPADTTDSLCNNGMLLSFDAPAADINPLKDPTGYEISIWTDNGSIVYLENDSNLGANTSYAFSNNLTPGDTIYWQVKPYNDSDTNKNCTVWYFVTAPDANPVPVIAVKGDVSRSVDVCSGVDALFGLTDANSTPYTSATYDWDGTDNTSYPLNDTTIAEPIFNSTVFGTTYELALIVTDQYGCTGVDTVDVFVKEPATSGSIVANGGTKICDGSSAELGLVGSDGDIEWKFSTISPSGALTTTGDIDDKHTTDPIIQDIYYVAIVNLNGCVDTTDIFIEKEELPFKPVITNSDLSFCDGDSILLNTVWPDLGTLEWNDATMSTTQSIWVKESGDYIVTGTGLNGCSNDSDPAAVVKNELPNDPIVNEMSGTPCQGDSIQLKVDIAGADSLFWFVNGMLSSAYNSSTDYNIRNDVSYQFVNKTSEGCISDTVDYSVAFGSAPNKPIVNILSNDSLQIIGDATTYYWYLDDGTLVSTETDSIFEPTENGSYFVVGGNGPCLSEPSDTVIVDLYNGILSVDENEQIVVFPNPNSGNFNIKLLSRSTINIRDIYGKVVYHNEHYSGVVGIELNITTGVYIMEVLTNQHLVTMTRIIVE
jgi:hypothetical protein